MCPPAIFFYSMKMLGLSWLAYQMLIWPYQVPSQGLMAAVIGASRVVWCFISVSHRSGKSTNISMISNSVTHLRSYIKTAIAHIDGNSARAPISQRQAPMSPRQELMSPHRGPMSLHRAPILSHWMASVSWCFKSVSWYFTSDSCLTGGSRCFMCVSRCITIFYKYFMMFYYV